MRLIHLSPLLLVVPLAMPAGAQEPAGSDDALKIARELTEKGARLFDTLDARAMAETYTEDAVAIFTTKNQNTGKLDSETYQRRPAIEDMYSRYFKDARDMHARNNVDSARFLSPGVLQIEGTFQPKQENDNLKLPFVQVRVRDGKDWKIATMQVFLLPKS